MTTRLVPGDGRSNPARCYLYNPTSQTQNLTMVEGAGCEAHLEPSGIDERGLMIEPERTNTLLYSYSYPAPPKPSSLPLVFGLLEMASIVAVVIIACVAGRRRR